jgi:hypothetical protein
MTGKIIPFKSHRDPKRGRLYREQAVPRRARRSKGPSRSPDPADPASGARNTQILDLQLARITHLLEDLEELTCSSARKAHPADDSEDNPPPEIDSEKLDRLYRDLDSNA